MRSLLEIGKWQATILSLLWHASESHTYSKRSKSENGQVIMKVINRDMDDDLSDSGDCKVNESLNQQYFGGNRDLENTRRLLLLLLKPMIIIIVIEKLAIVALPFTSCYYCIYDSYS